MIFKLLCVVQMRILQWMAIGCKITPVGQEKKKEARHRKKYDQKPSFYYCGHIQLRVVSDNALGHFRGHRTMKIKNEFALPHAGPMGYWTYTINWNMKYNTSKRIHSRKPYSWPFIQNMNADRRRNRNRSHQGIPVGACKNFAHTFRRLIDCSNFIELNEFDNKFGAFFVFCFESQLKMQRKAQPRNRNYRSHDTHIWTGLWKNQTWAFPSTKRLFSVGIQIVKCANAGDWISRIQPLCRHV